MLESGLIQMWIEEFASQTVERGGHRSEDGVVKPGSLIPGSRPGLRGCVELGVFDDLFLRAPGSLEAAQSFLSQRSFLVAPHQETPRVSGRISM